jgi:hypothetical protein
LAFGALAEAARRPRLWTTALAQWVALTGPRWWARWPPLPQPPRDYMAFRLQAMYGSSGATMDGAELVAYLEWCRRMRALAR